MFQERLVDVQPTICVLGEWKGEGESGMRFTVDRTFLRFAKHLVHVHYLHVSYPRLYTCR